MDTTKHLEVAQEAFRGWVKNSSDMREASEVAVTTLDSKRLLCTEAEREFIEARLAWEADRGGATLDRFFAAKSALLAERAGWPVEPAPSEQSQAPAPAAESVEVEIPPIAMPEGVVVKLKLRTPEDRAAYFAQKFHDAIAEIASLKERIAEARSRPENAKAYMLTFEGQKYVVEASSMGGAVKAWRDAMRPEWGDDWEGDEEPDQVALLNDEPVIRAHAAKLDAEQGGQS